jgi:hypothetical protein
VQGRPGVIQGSDTDPSTQPVRLVLTRESLRQFWRDNQSMRVLSVTCSDEVRLAASCGGGSPCAGVEDFEEKVAAAVEALARVLPPAEQDKLRQAVERGE